MAPLHIKIRDKEAFFLVEILVAIAIFSIFAVGVFYVSVDTLQRDSKIELDNVAVLYAQEGLEAVRNMRDRNYLLLTNGDHGLQFENDVWSFIPAPEDIDGFYSRTIIVEDVYRDVNGDIAESGTYDPETKKVTSEVFWTLKGVIPRSASLTSYIANWTGNDWIQETCSEFSVGIFDNTETVPADFPPEDNCDIELAISEVQSSFFSSSDIGDHGNDVFVNGNYAYIANNKSQTGLSIINVSDPENPVLTSHVNIGGRGRHVVRQGNYAYLTVDKSNVGLAVVDVSAPASAFLVTTLDVGDQGNDLAASGSYLYMGIDDDDDSFKIIDISTPSNPSIIGSLDFDEEVQAVTVNGDYVYLGLEDDHQGFKIVNISSPNNPLEEASLDVGEEVNAIAISGFIAFVGTEDSHDSLQVVNISDPSNPSIVTSFDVGGEIEGLSIEGDYLYAALDEQNSGLAAINIEDPLAPYLVYNLDITGKGTGIFAGSNYVYVTLNTNNRGMIIVGITMSAAAASGTYISSVFDTGSADTRYNFIEWEHTEVPGGSVQFQIRTADTSSNLDSAAWIGSDGTSGTFYENARTAITLDPYRTGVRYFQFQAFFTSDGVSTPLLESVRINFTP